MNTQKESMSDCITDEFDDGMNETMDSTLAQDLEQRCADASITMEEEVFSGETSHRVLMPAGRDTVTVFLFNSNKLKRFLDIPFESYTLFGDYSAFCSYQEGFIEAGLDFLTRVSPNSLLKRLWGSDLPDEGESDTPPPYRIKNSSGQITMTIGPASETLHLLGDAFLRRGMSLRIDGLEIGRLKDALDILERLSNSLFFQLDLTHNLALSLSRRRTPFRRTRIRSERNWSALEFPRHEYDNDPLSLYWYARSAAGMPLLQFLAYYQSIEYYFPSYSEVEAQKRLRNLLKSPTFRADKDADLTKLIRTARTTSKGFGSERDQLRATITECIEPRSLRGFLTTTEERKKFFIGRAKGLTDHALLIRDDDADLRSAVADRLYDIRCKIVHTKSGGSDGEMEFLLPFSKEAELMYEDIALVRYVAQEVLVSASSKLSL